MDQFWTPEVMISEEHLFHIYLYSQKHLFHIFLYSQTKMIKLY